MFEFGEGAVPACLRIRAMLIRRLSSLAVAQQIDADPVQIGIWPADDQSPGKAQRRKLRKGFLNDVAGGLPIRRGGSEMAYEVVRAPSVKGLNIRTPILKR